MYLKGWWSGALWFLLPAWLIKTFNLYVNATWGLISSSHLQRKIINSSLMPQLPEFMAYPLHGEREREREREKERVREECNETRALQVMKLYQGWRMTPRTNTSWYWCPGCKHTNTLETATHGNSDINIWVIPIMQYLLNSINEKGTRREFDCVLTYSFLKHLNFTNDI